MNADNVLVLNLWVLSRAAEARALRLPLAIPLLLFAAYAQTARPMRFEVASVKPGGDIFSTRPDLSPGRIRWTTQLAYLIGYAHHLDFSQVSGSHLGDVYTVEATFEPTATDEEVRLMVQSLLSDRFKMRFHRATTETDGYALSVGSGGIKAKSANGADEPSARPADSHIFATVPEPGVVAITGHNSSIAKLAETLQRSLKVPIWDRTGLAGSYDFAFRYAQDPAAEFHADAPALATALRDSLGLTLKKAKGPLETLVIDNIEQPTEN